MGEIVRSIQKIHVALDNRQTYHQSVIMEIEGKNVDQQISGLIDPGASLIYITPKMMEVCN